MHSLTRWQLALALLSDWHIGNGREGGTYADSLVNRDHLGLPVVNGKSLKGLLRQAFFEAQAYGWLAGCSPNILERLFGQEGPGLQAQGLLQVSNARLSPTELAFFQENPTARSLLYRVHHSTAIDTESGVAKEGSLRSAEVVIPLTLIAELSLAEPVPWPLGQWLTMSLPLIMALGGKRRRGFGEVSISAKELH